MKNDEVKTINLIVKNYNRRTEARIDLPITLYIRRPFNSTEYWREVRTENVSYSGVCINSEINLEIGVQLEINGFEKRFSGNGIVKHVQQRWDGRWSIGLKLLSKSGQWIIS